MFKMDTNQKITYGIIGVLSVIIAAFGGSMYLTPDQLDHAYVCSINENVAFSITHLSSTQKTAYWNDDSGIEQSSVCKNGVWIKLKDYAASKGVSVESLLKQENTIMEIPNPVIIESGGIGQNYKCNQVKCEVIP